MKGTKLYKLTDKHGKTQNDTQWGKGITHSGTGEGELCSEGWIHAYTHPLLAVLFNPIHADFKTPRLWEARGFGKKKSDGLKVGFQSITTIKEIPLPEITMAQRVAFAILVAKKVCEGAKWNEWADKWLSGEDRTADVAYAHAANAYTVAAYAAYAHAANAAAHVAHDAAYAAYAAAAKTKINFVRIAQKVIKEF